MAAVDSRLPSLGPRGEGWVLGQFVLIGLVAFFAFRGSPSRARRSAADFVAVAAGMASIASGVALGVRAGKDLGSALTPLPRPRREAELVETGSYRSIRHPIYDAIMLVAAGFATARRSAWSLVGTGVLAAWLDAKARREEAWLAAQFRQYAAYRARTWRFVPRVY